MEVRDVLPKDAIPSIDDPTFAKRYDWESDDELLVVEGEPTKAYPIRILNFHEIVNDVVNETPIAITWCPLCASAVVYERTVDGSELTFGVSGKLADDDLVLYDQETESEWKQSLGTCIAGKYEGNELTVVPAGVVTSEQFESAFPDGIVLQPPHTESEAASDTDEPAPVDYDDNPYEAYFQSDEFGLDGHREGNSRTWDRADIHPKTAVLGIERDGDAIGYPRPTVRSAGGTVSDTVGGVSVLVVATDTGMYAYENPGIEFELVEDRLIGGGITWNPVTGAGEDGRFLDRMPARRLFAFTWQDDHGTGSFYKLPS